MRRFAFYILVASMTFGLAYLIVSKLFQHDLKTTPIPETMPQIKEKNNGMGIGFGQGDWSFKEEIDKFEKIDKLTCTNNNLLPVWRQLKKEFFPKGIYLKREGNDCSEIFEFKKIDLNEDGVKEIIVRGASFNACIFNGNCGFLIFKKEGKFYEKILFTTDYFEASGKIGNQVKSNKTFGYKNILVAEHISSSDTMSSTFKFNGKKYVEDKCVVKQYREINGEEAWETVNCKEYFK